MTETQSFSLVLADKSQETQTFYLNFPSDTVASQSDSCREYKCALLCFSGLEDPAHGLGKSVATTSRRTIFVHL